MNAAGYVVHRELDPKPSNPDGLDFILTPAERDLARIAALQLERRRRELNRRDTAQAAADALAREMFS